MDMDNDRRLPPISNVREPDSKAAPYKGFRPSAKQRRAPDSIEWDAEFPGLGIRLRGSTGDGTWVVQWRERGTSRRRSLGAVHQLRRDEARTLARELMGHQIATGPALPPLIAEFVPTFLADCVSRG
jgi:hypothetical protein